MQNLHLSVGIFVVFIFSRFLNLRSWKKWPKLKKWPIFQLWRPKNRQKMKSTKIPTLK